MKVGAISRNSLIFKLILLTTTAAAAIAIFYVILTLVDINRNSGVITLLFSGIVAVATLCYALLTWQLVSETRKMREVQTNPKIFVEVQPKGAMLGTILTTDLHLVIRNVGLGPAYDIKPEIIEERGLEGPKKSLFEGLKIFDKGIEYLAPNSEVSLLFEFVDINYLERLSNYFVKIRVEYFKYPKEMRGGSSMKWLRRGVYEPITDIYAIDFSYIVQLIPRSGSNVLTTLQGIKAELAKMRQI